MGGRIVRKAVADPLPPLLGKLHIGKKAVSQSGKEYPAACDFFVPSGKYASLFTQAYGETPSSLLIYFPSDDPSLVCNERYEYRDSRGKKIAEGDGEEFLVFSAKEGKRIRLTTEQMPDIMERIAEKFPSPQGWQVTLTLKFVLPLVSRIYGVWSFETKAVASSIPQIRDCFDSMLAKNGRIAGVLCDLNVKFAKSDSPLASKFPVVSLVPNETEQNLSQIQALKQIGQ